MKTQIKDLMTSIPVLTTVISALALIAATLIGALIPSCNNLSQTKQENSELRSENRRLSEEIGPFKTAALIKYGSQDSTAILSLATNLLSIQQELRTVHAITTNIESRTSIIRDLPDGRKLIGDFISGEPSFLFSLQKDAVEAYNRRDFTNALASAMELVRRYESSKEESKHAVLGSANTASSQIVANMYSMLLEEAMSTGDYDKALSYAEKAIALNHTPSNDALKAAVLSNKKDFPQIEKMFAQYCKESQNQRNIFFGSLIQYGYLLPRSGSECNFDLLKKEFDLSIELKTPGAYRVMFPMGTYTNAEVFVNLWLGLDKVLPSFYETVRVR